MPFNLTTFKTRAFTAIVFVAIMLAGLLWNIWSFVILFTLIHFGCWYEFIQLMYKINKKKYLLYCSLGLFYITLPILALLDLRTLGNGFNFFQPDNRYGLVFPLIVIGSMWINDTMAYVVGSLIGKTPFSKISPKKTWEGTIGGVILCIVVVGLVASFATKELFYIKNYHWFIIAGISAVAGTIGDLLESKLKRMANVKDSGSIMPGHGGFLDRFDSLLVTAPLVWFYVKLFIGVI